MQGNHLVNLLYEGFDLIIHCGSLPDSNLYFKKIRDWYKFTCASPGYIDKHGMPKTPDDLQQHQCLDHYDNRRQTWYYKLNQHSEAVYINAMIKANDSLALRNMALNDLGIVNLPDFTVMQDIQQQQLVRLLDEYELDPLAMYVVYAEQQPLAKKVQCVLEFLLESLCVI